MRVMVDPTGWEELGPEWREILSNVLVGLLVGARVFPDDEWFPDAWPEIPIALRDLGLVRGVHKSEHPDGGFVLSPGPGVLSAEGHRFAQAELRRRMGLSADGRRHVFVSYVRDDASEVDALCSRLTAAGVVTWRDTQQLIPGDEWQTVIRNAIASGVGFIACFSNNSEMREESYMREELLLALEHLRRRPASSGWFLPVKLSPCEIPNHAIGGGRTLADVHFERLHEDFEGGIGRLLSAIDRLQL